MSKIKLDKIKAFLKSKFRWVDDKIDDLFATKTDYNKAEDLDGAERRLEKRLKNQTKAIEKTSKKMTKWGEKLTEAQSVKSALEEMREITAADLAKVKAMQTEN